MFIGIAICLNNPNYFPLTNINIIIKQFSIINVLLYIIFITTVLFFMIRRTSNGSLAYYPGEVDKRVPLNERSFLYRLISKYRFVLKREFFSPAMIFGSLLGYKFLAILITLGVLTGTGYTQYPAIGYIMLAFYIYIYCSSSTTEDMLFRIVVLTTFYFVLMHKVCLIF